MTEETEMRYHIGLSPRFNAKIPCISLKYTVELCSLYTLYTCLTRKRVKGYLHISCWFYLSMDWLIILLTVHCVQVLSGEKLPMERGRVLRRPHFLSNCNTALEFLKSKRVSLLDFMTSYYRLESKKWKSNE